MPIQAVMADVYHALLCKDCLNTWTRYMMGTQEYVNAVREEQYRLCCLSEPDYEQASMSAVRIIELSIAMHHLARKWIADMQ
jgi:hypothetical protein